MWLKEKAVVDIGHMKGNYAVLVQSLEKQAEVGVKELKKNYESANKKKIL